MKLVFQSLNEAITLEMMGQSHHSNLTGEIWPFLKTMNEQTNIDFKFRTATSDQYQQQKQLAFQVCSFQICFLEQILQLLKKSIMVHRDVNSIRRFN